jgi:small subunit ribosomal protein S17
MAKKIEKKNIEEDKFSSGISIRGRKFQGTVIRKFDKRVTIEFERVRYVKKYKRYSKAKTKIHAYLPENLKEEINLGDYIQVQECRPLSKIIHAVVVKKIRSVDGGKE